MGNKKSFVMYQSWGSAIDHMSNEQAGELIKSIYAYQSGEDVCPDDQAVQFVFDIIRQKMDEDSEQYEKVCQARSAAGKLGGRPKKQEDNGSDSENQKKAKKAIAFPESKRKQKNPDTDTDSDTDINYKEKDKRETRKKLSADADRSPSLARKKKTESVNAGRKEPYADDPNLDEAIRNFIRYRESRKSKLTPYALKLNQQKLEKLAPGDTEKQIAIINQTIERGWTGLFPLDEDKARGAPPGRGTSAKKPNSFNDFKQRHYDYDELEGKLLEKGRKGK
ncbi:MAG: DUF6291 domain-containing protein [Bilifractor sp.]|jgi:hypothetical protein